MDKPLAETRARYPHLFELATRWADNDVYGHVNNAVYYFYFDTVVNRYLVDHGVLDVLESPIFGVVVETGCRYFSSIAFPDLLDIGLRVAKIGNSSVRYELAIFRREDAAPAATGHFIQVYVDRVHRKPVLVPQAVREVLGALLVTAD
jgi:acyl-CoA thioester hydrolase